MDAVCSEAAKKPPLPASTGEPAWQEAHTHNAKKYCLLASPVAIQKRRLFQKESATAATAL